MLRRQLWKGTLLSLANRLGSRYASTIYNIERQWRTPELPTIGKHAAALSCAPWQLLEDVETEYDIVRRIGRLPRDDAEREWRVLLNRFQESTKRGQKDQRQPRQKGGMVK